MKNYILAGIAGLAILACAKQPKEDTDAIEQRALDEWMEKYHADAVKMDEGGYYEVLTAPQADAEQATVGKWLRISYVIKDLEGNVILQREEALAKQLGAFTRYTHYVSDFVYLADAKNSTMIKGQYLNLLDMRVGEVRRLYLPSRLGWGASGVSNSIGYGGQYSLAGSKPFIVDDLQIIEIIDDAQAVDYQAVDDVATAWGISPADSVKSHLYLQKLYTEGILGDTVKADSTARIYYVGRFLDGFVFDTNIDSIRKRVYGEVRTSADTAALLFKRSSAISLPASIFVYPSEHFIYGDSIRMVVSSIYAYGSAGRTGYSTENSLSGSSTTLLRTEIQPYTPLIYDFVVLPRK